MPQAAIADRTGTSVSGPDSSQQRFTKSGWLSRLATAHALLGLFEQNEILSGNTFQFLTLPKGKSGILSDRG
jgi:hypothetical protein